MNILTLTTSAFTLALFAVTSVEAQSVLYKTGFESNKGIVLGPVDGQDGWVGDSACEIQDWLVDAGKQALHIDASAAFAAAGKPLDYSIDRTYLTIRHRFLRTEVNSQAGLAVWGDTGFLAQIATFGDYAVLGNSDNATSAVPFASGIWHQLELRLDFAKQLVSASIDDVLIGTLPLNPPSPPNSVGAMVVYSFEAGGKPNDLFVDQLMVIKSGAPLN